MARDEREGFPVAEGIFFRFGYSFFSEQGLNPFRSSDVTGGSGVIAQPEVRASIGGKKNQVMMNVIVSPGPGDDDEKGAEKYQQPSSYPVRQIPGKKGQEQNS